jgi:hypothetical protein
MSTRERPPGTVADELHVALEALRELSPEHEPAVGIPVTAVAGSVGLAGIIAVWTAIVS